MQIRLGSELIYRCPQPTPMVLMLRVHPEQAGDLLTQDLLTSEPAMDTQSYLDGYGNRCIRVVAPAGMTTLRIDSVIAHHGRADGVAPHARQLAIEALPDQVLVFLLSSRYCDTELLLQTAWQLFATAPTGWARVQAICDFVYGHLTFGYERADPTRTASRGFAERHGVCRDYAHLAITLCRCMNIPARYCTGYLSDIGMPPTDVPMDFTAWMEVYLDSGWHTFDPRNNATMPRHGRVLMARGRDAADVAIVTSFGEAQLESFLVWADPVVATSPVL